MSKSKQVLELTNKGLKAGEIAKKLKTSAAYVYFVRHTAKKKKSKNKAQFKSPRSRLINDLFQVKKALDVVESKPTKLLIQPQYEDIAKKILADSDPVNNPPRYTDRPKHRLQATETDLVNRPPHYTKGGIDFLDYAEAKGLTENAYLFNVVKYISRAGKKLGVDPVQDLEKAEFYLKREIARRKSA